MDYSIKDVEALNKRTYELIEDMRRMKLPHGLIDKAGDLNDRLLQHSIAMKYPVPLKDIDFELRGTLHDLFDRYGMKGIADAVALMQAPHRFQGKSDRGNICHWCGQDYQAVKIHGAV